MQTNSWEAEPDLSSLIFSSGVLLHKLWENASTYHKASLVQRKKECPRFHAPRGALWNTPVLSCLTGALGPARLKQNIGFVPGTAGCQHIVGLTCKECSPWQAASSWHQCQMISTIIVTISDFSCCFCESLLRQLGYSKALNNSYSGEPNNR